MENFKDMRMPLFSVDNNIFSQANEAHVCICQNADQAENIVYCANRLHELRFNDATTKNDYDSFCSFLLTKLMDDCV